MKEIDAKIKEAMEYVNKHCIIDKEDIVQEVVVFLLEHPQCENISKVCDFVRKKYLSNESKHQRGRAESLYNDDGECLDDNYYFVDQSTVEQYGERKSEVTDEQREKVAKFSHCMGLINVIFSEACVFSPKAKYSGQWYIDRCLSNRKIKGTRIFLHGKQGGLYVH